MTRFEADGLDREEDSEPHGHTILFCTDELCVSIR